MLIERARALVDRDGSELAVELGVPYGSPTKAIIRSLTTGLDREPIERKLEVVAYLAQHGTIITFDKRFEAYCRGEKYSLGVHASNMELHLLQDRLGLIQAPAMRLDLPPEPAANHTALLGQNPLIQDSVNSVLASASERSFIHVGANDLRDTDDQSHKWIIAAPDWMCFLLEPQPRVFKRLLETVRDAPNVKPINAAIADHDGTAELTVFRLDVWSSMAPQTLAMRAKFNEPTRVVEVKCMTASTLLRTHGLQNPGFLMIDTEGLDRIILDQFLDVCRPGLIICEVAHVPSDETPAMLNRLGALGYDYCLINECRDILAIREDWLPAEA